MFYKLYSRLKVTVHCINEYEQTDCGNKDTFEFSKNIGITGRIISPKS